jgi:hypothetical protein
MAAGFIHPVTAQSYPNMVSAGAYFYYLQPGIDGSYHYMDVFQPNGPADSGSAGIFNTRVLGATVTLSWYGATLYVVPEPYDRFYKVMVGWVDEQFQNEVIWTENEKVLVPSAANVVGFRFNMSQMTVAAGDRLRFWFGCLAAPAGLCPHPLRVDALWGDAAHPSRFECSLDPSVLLGQPVPEFPAPIVAVVTVLAGLLVIGFYRIRVRRYAGYLRVRGC